MGSTSLADKHRLRQLMIGILLLLFIVGGWFYPPIGYFLVVCMLGATGVGIFKGRNWCDWFCPRGSFWDHYLSPLSRKIKVPYFFRSIYFRLLWLGILMTVLVFKLTPVWGDFYEMGRPFVMILTVTTVVGLLLGIVYHHRIWCMFCPMGTMANWLGKNKVPLYVSDSCIGCGSREEVCRMQINPGQYRELGLVKDGDCLKCSYCVEACPRQALSFGQKARPDAA